MSGFPVTTERDHPAGKWPGAVAPPRALASFHALQEWEGYVTAISEDTFTADLVDITRASTVAEEQSEFLLSDLDSHQRTELRIGSVFRWAIGYERSSSGTRKRVSQLVFRQLPRWTQADIEYWLIADFGG